jgi:hypothetical protein
MITHPYCSTCPCYVEKPKASCALEPTWLPISNPKIHFCSHHPNWILYIDSLKRGSESRVDSFQIPNCECVKIGMSFHMPPLSVLHTDNSGTPYVAMTDCEHCHGSGRIPGKPARKF